VNITRIVAATVCLLAAPLLVAPQAAAQPAGSVTDSAPTVMAVWVEKEVDFPYQGITSYYTCNGLRDKVTAILRAIGARPGFKVDVRSCPDYPGPERMPWAHIRAALPQAATPEATAQFPAQWTKVRLEGDPLGPVQQGDCELVEEMRDHAFVQLGARIVEDHVACIPRAVTPASLNITLEVLRPVPGKK
jgi:hypothetical protein